MALFQLFLLEKAAECLLKKCVQNSANIEIRILGKKEMKSHKYLFSGFLFSIHFLKLL